MASLSDSEVRIHDKLDDIIQRLVRVETNQTAYATVVQEVGQLQQDAARIKGMGRVLSLIWTAFGAAFMGHILWGKR